MALPVPCIQADLHSSTSRRRTISPTRQRCKLCSQEGKSHQQIYEHPPPSKIFQISSTLGVELPGRSKRLYRLSDNGRLATCDVQWRGDIMLRPIWYYMFHFKRAWNRSHHADVSFRNNYQKFAIKGAQRNHSIFAREIVFTHAYLPFVQPTQWRNTVVSKGLILPRATLSLLQPDQWRSADLAGWFNFPRIHLSGQKPAHWRNTFFTRGFNLPRSSQPQ
jgi:hypothetical protein